jgi:hypothetical protein
MLDRTGLILLSAALFCQGCVTSGAPPQPSGTSLQQAQVVAPGSNTAMRGESAPAAGAASRVYRDPVTGEFTVPPPEVKVPTAPVTVREATSTAPTPTMKETAVEGGGTKLDLQGRFRSYVSATKDSEGKITVHCDDRPPAEQH